MMQRKTSSAGPQRQTAHIVRRTKGNRYHVWLGVDPVGTSVSLTQARKLAAGTKAEELCECWERGKCFERSKRGAWRPIS